MPGNNYKHQLTSDGYLLDAGSPLVIIVRKPTALLVRTKKDPPFFLILASSIDFPERAQTSH